MLENFYTTPTEKLEGRSNCERRIFGISYPLFGLDLRAFSVLSDIKRRLGKRYKFVNAIKSGLNIKFAILETATAVG